MSDDSFMPLLRLLPQQEQTRIYFSHRDKERQVITALRFYFELNDLPSAKQGDISEALGTLRYFYANRNEKYDLAMPNREQGGNYSFKKKEFESLFKQLQDAEYEYENDKGPEVQEQKVKAGLTETQLRRQSIEDELTKLRRKIQDLEQRITERDAEKAEFSAQLLSVQRENSALQDELSVQKAANIKLYREMQQAVEKSSLELQQLRELKKNDEEIKEMKMGQTLQLKEQQEEQLSDALSRLSQQQSELLSLQREASQYRGENEILKKQNEEYQAETRQQQQDHSALRQEYADYQNRQKIEYQKVLLQLQNLKENAQLTSSMRTRENDALRAGLQQQVQDLTQERATLQGRVDALEAQAQAAEELADQYKSEIGALQARLAGMNSQISLENSRHQQDNDDKLSIKCRMESLADDLKVQKAIVQKQIRQLADAQLQNSNLAAKNERAGEQLEKYQVIASQLKNSILKVREEYDKVCAAFRELQANVLENNSVNDIDIAAPDVEVPIREIKRLLLQHNIEFRDSDVLSTSLANVATALQLFLTAQPDARAQCERLESLLQQEKLQRMNLDNEVQYLQELQDQLQIDYQVQRAEGAKHSIINQQLVRSLSGAQQIDARQLESDVDCQQLREQNKRLMQQVQQLQNDLRLTAKKSLMISTQQNELQPADLQLNNSQNEQAGDPSAAAQRENQALRRQAAEYEQQLIQLQNRLNERDNDVESLRNQLGAPTRQSEAAAERATDQQGQQSNTQPKSLFGKMKQASGERQASPELHVKVQEYQRTIEMQKQEIAHLEQINQDLQEECEDLNVRHQQLQNDSAIHSEAADNETVLKIQNLQAENLKLNNYIIEQEQKQSETNRGYEKKLQELREQLIQSKQSAELTIIKMELQKCRDENDQLRLRIPESDVLQENAELRSQIQVLQKKVTMQQSQMEEVQQRSMLESAAESDKLQKQNDELQDLLKAKEKFANLQLKLDYQQRLKQLQQENESLKNKSMDPSLEAALRQYYSCKELIDQLLPGKQAMEEKIQQLSLKSNGGSVISQLKSMSEQSVKICGKFLQQVDNAVVKELMKCFGMYFGTIYQIIAAIAQGCRIEDAVAKLAACQSQLSSQLI